MIRNITENDLVLLAYDELDNNRKTQVLLALEANSELMDCYHQMMTVHNALDNYILKPNPTSLQIILEESSSAMEVH